MRVLIIDPMAAGLDLAMRAQAHGHDVKLSIKPDKKTESIGKGCVEVIPDPRPWLRWSEFVIATDNTLYMRDLDNHRAAGGLVLAASQETAAWEINREIGQQVLRKAGIPTIPSVSFTNYDKAIEFVKRTMGRYVSKPSGDGTADKALSYCSTGPADMIYMLERWKRNDKLKGSFILQEFVEGIEMGVAGWFGPEGWNEGWEENFEFKKLCNGDLGCATGEQGTVMRTVRSSKLARKMLLPLTKQLERARYVGNVDVNCIIDERGNAWPLEFTMRLGWPAFQIHTELLNGKDAVAWLHGLATGRDTRPFAPNTIGIGVVLSIPDYPYSHATQKEVVGVPIYGITPSLWRHVHPSEMMIANCPCESSAGIVTRPLPATAGDYVLTMTAQAATVQEAREIVYRRLKRLDVPSSPMYRTDIGVRLKKHLPKLQAMGYAMGMVFSDSPKSSNAMSASHLIAITKSSPSRPISGLPTN